MFYPLGGHTSNFQVDQESILSRLSDSSASHPTFTPLQKQINEGLQHFTIGLVQGQTLLSLATGAFVNPLAKLPFLAEAARFSPNIQKGLQLTASLVGLGAEAFAIEATHSLLSPQSKNFSESTSFGNRVLLNGLNLAVFKSIHHLSLTQNPLIQSLLLDVSMISAQEISSLTGLSPKMEDAWMNRWVEARILNMQLGATQFWISKGLSSLHAHERLLRISGATFYQPSYHFDKREFFPEMIEAAGTFSSVKAASQKIGEGPVLSRQDDWKDRTRRITPGIRQEGRGERITPIHFEKMVQGWKDVRAIVVRKPFSVSSMEKFGASVEIIVNQIEAHFRQQSRSLIIDFKGGEFSILDRSELQTELTRLFREMKISEDVFVTLMTETPSNVHIYRRVRGEVQVQNVLMAPDSELPPDLVSRDSRPTPERASLFQDLYPEATPYTSPVFMMTSLAKLLARGKRTAKYIPLEDADGVEWKMGYYETIRGRLNQLKEFKDVKKFALIVPSRNEIAIYAWEKGRVVYQINALRTPSSPPRG